MYRKVACLGCKCEIVAKGQRGRLPTWCVECKRQNERDRSCRKHSAEASKGHSRQCQRCQCGFVSRSRSAKYCSRRCQYLNLGKAAVIECHHCGNQFDVHASVKDARKYCSNACKYAARRPEDRTCKECGKAFCRSPKGENGKNDKALYCSKPCYFVAKRAGRVECDEEARMRVHWHRGGRWRNGPFSQAMRAIEAGWAQVGKCMAIVSVVRSKMDRMPKCETCGALCGCGAKRFCSYKCNKAWKGDRQCKCGRVVPDCSAYSNPHCEVCKLETRRRHRRMYGDYRKRCRTYGGHFNAQVKPKDVFVRDKWKCHICGKKTSKVFAVDDPRSATVDHHPVPLSKGGDHDWGNVRCACFMCNSIKRNSWDGQRRLALSG